MSIMTVIIPIRISPERIDAIERLDYMSLDQECPTSIEFMIVDDGSPKYLSEKLIEKCRCIGATYLRIESETSLFSIGRARNFGAQNANGKYILFQDVDLMPYNGFYNDAINECSIQKLDKFADNFIMFGVIYLTQDATSEFIETPHLTRKSKFIQYLIEDNKDKIEKFSTGTSVTIWRKDHYLCTGGNDPEFEAWGFEDLEYTCRAFRRNRKFPLPSDAQLDYSNFSSIQEYKGWKSIYRLFGDITFKKGMVMFHAWHPIEHNSNYIQGKSENKKKFEKKIADFAKTGKEPEALKMISSGKSIIFRNNPWVYNKWTSPFFGELILLDECDFDGIDIIKYIENNQIDRVIFHNPYSSEKMHSIYNVIRGNLIPYYVCERGALPDSVFIDSNGFNYDSSSYHPQNWDLPLTEQQRKDCLKYIINEKNSQKYLELQPEKITPYSLKNTLHLNPLDKILFIPLQRPTDTVIQHFCGPIGSYENFISLIEELVEALPSSWKVVIKKHPLENSAPDIPGAYYANNFNITSLIEASNAILLINSGVGVTGLIHEKPVFVAGNAFYNHSGLCKSVTTATELINSIDNFKPCQEKVIRFIKYLSQDFYSFANFKTRLVDWTDGSKMTATTAIDYYILRVPNFEEMVLERSTAPKIQTSSILFDRYRNQGGIIRTGAPKKTPSTSNLPQEHKQNQNKSSIEQKNITRKRKFKKLVETPGKFFRDSRHGIFKILGKVIK
ncbi:capsular polysaccharide export protein, LipB/KpsS family [Chromobacterium vaccinii]|uniref:capsular polysaccharide export protein, LipB/KpsS family n=1 Tax=Chromobacterium vaccinii TaxID=1108595 RepID=UPI000AF2BCD1|nr:glycosyltransferase [Chromobacterium vaccinii]